MLGSVTERMHLHSDKWMPFHNNFMKKTWGFGRHGPACADSESENMSMRAVSMCFCTLLHFVY